MLRRGRRAILAVITLAAGCAAEVPVGQPDIDVQAVATRAASVTMQPASRHQVRAELGQPWLTRASGDLDVFRLEGRQRRLLVFFAPYPLPMPAASQKLGGYAVVQYDDSAMVVAADAAFGTLSGNAFDAVVLQAGDFEFVHADGDMLTIEAARFLQESLAGPPESACTLLVGCEQACANDAASATDCGVCWTRVRIDEAPVRELPLVQVLGWKLAATAPAPSDARTREDPPRACEDVGGRVVDETCYVDRRLLVPLRLSPGRHQLTGRSRWVDGEVRGEFQCTAGEIVFAALGSEPGRAYSVPEQLSHGLRKAIATGTVRFEREPPDSLDGQRVLLNVDGTWLVP